MYFMAHVLVKIWQVATINRHSVSYNEKPFSLSPRTVCRWAFWVVGGLCATKSFRDPNQWSPHHPIGVLQICSIFYSAPSEKEHGESMAWFFMCCPGKDVLALCSNSIEGTQGPGHSSLQGNFGMLGNTSHLQLYLLLKRGWRILMDIEMFPLLETLATVSLVCNVL